ncbi:MAG: BrnA antitoxin family protein [Treponema sp.]|nr:BrnA antitoxin family protein [Treponema sp.]
MGMTTITVRAGQKPTKEQIKRIRAAAKAPINYTADCPESTPAALAEFAARARELRQSMKAIKPAVTIRISPSCLSKYKSLGKGYTGIMADVLDYVAENPDILAKARG